MRSPRRPDPRPIETNDVTVFAVGTAVWAIVLVVLLLFWSRIDPSYHWWAWVCVAAIAGGLFGIALGPRIKRRGVSRSRRADGSLQAPPAEHADHAGHSESTARPANGAHAAELTDDEPTTGGSR